MKTNYYLLIALVAILSSCVREEADEFTYRTRAAYTVFQTTEEVICKKTDLLELVQNANLYVEATSDEERRKIEDSLFYYAKIRYYQDTLTILKQNRELRIATTGKSINEVNTVWNLCGNQNKQSMCSVTCLGADHWQMKTDLFQNDWMTGLLEEHYHYSNRYLIVEDFTLDFKRDQGIYQVSGRGSYHCEEMSDVDYEILLPIDLRCEGTTYRHSFQNGKIEMIISTKENPKPERIHSDLTDSKGSLVRNKITYKGISEVW